MAALSTSDLAAIVPIDDDCHFTIHNIPFGVFVQDDAMNPEPHCATAIGDYVVDLCSLQENGYFSDYSWGECFREPTLNSFMAQGRGAWKEARERLQTILCDQSLPQHEDFTSMLILQEECRMLMPAKIGDYTDFYSSIHHATNVGTMFRGKENALKPNWAHLPVGYHGRASSVVVSGTDIIRPTGQLKKGDDVPPTDEACRLMDFEVEMAFFVGPPSQMGQRIPIEKANDHIFGVVLMNDWSARDIQKWEYVPLGPFNGKNFATTISPWIVTMEALEPFRIPAMEQNIQNKIPLPYLQDPDLHSYNIPIQVGIQPEGGELQTVGSTNSENLYWTFSQQLAHHTSTGCPFNTGDLCGTGTISGVTEDSYGSMLEICWKGTRSISMNDGSERKFIKDGDNVVMTALCKDPNTGITVGFGNCSGKVLPANVYAKN